MYSLRTCIRGCPPIKDMSTAGCPRRRKDYQGISIDARLELTSGVKTERGTMVQKKPRETQCVANLRMPK